MLKETEQELYKIVKMRINLEYKQIKIHNFYNFLNDGLLNLTIDCRKVKNDDLSKEDKYLINSSDLDNFSFDNFLNGKINNSLRLILIIENDCEIKTQENLENLRNFIKECTLINSIYTINEENFINFQKRFNFYFLNKDFSSELQKNVAISNFPIMVLDEILFIGNYLNSRNKYQIDYLNIKTIISLLKEKDEILEKNFDNHHFFSCDEPNHGTINFNDIVDCVFEQINEKQTPILIYCFSGSTISLAVCITILMKFKKWSLMFSTAYMMKIIPDFKIPVWLNAQLNKFA